MVPSTVTVWMPTAASDFGVTVMVLVVLPVDMLAIAVSR